MPLDVTTAPRLPKVPEFKRGWEFVQKRYKKRRLAELGYAWRPQLTLYLWYDRSRRDYTVQSAVAVVGAHGNQTAYQLV